MAKKAFFILLMFLSVASYGQIKFEKGYFIDNNDVKIDCLIRNSDWNDNPTSFKYRLNETSEIQEGTISAIKEFGVEDLKYRRFTVNIDEGNFNASNLDDNPLLVLQTKTLYLKQIERGKAALYKFVNNSHIRFFYTINDSEIKFLEYKNYQLANGKIGENVRFKQELLNNLQCEKVSKSAVENLKYNENSLVGIFKKYNSCFATEENKIVYKETNKTLFNLTIRPGLTSSSFTFSYEDSDIYYEDVEANFGQKIGFRIGLEAEIILPFNKNKWSILIEPTYQGYKNEKIVNAKKATIDYQSIELPIGIRHYFFLNDHSKLFANAAFENDFPISKEAFYPHWSVSRPFQLRPSINASFGVGYNFRGFSIEGRIKSDRSFKTRGMDWSGKYSAMSVIIGYTIF